MNALDHFTVIKSVKSYEKYIDQKKKKKKRLVHALVDGMNGLNYYRKPTQATRAFVSLRNQRRPHITMFVLVLTRIIN